MSNCIILTLADGGDNHKDTQYRNYLLLKGISNDYTFLDDYFDTVAINNSEYSIHKKFDEPASTNDILIIREDAGGGGHSGLDSSTRSDIT